MSEIVAISGLGCICAAGRGVAALLAALRTGSSHLRRLEDPRLPLAGGLACGHVEHLPVGVPRTLALARQAVAEALSGLQPMERGDTGLITATTTAGMPESEAAYLGSTDETDVYREHPAHRLGDRLALEFGCTGPRSCHSAACASAACALAEATAWIRAGRCRRVLVVGADANTRLTLDGFVALKVVDPDGCRPLTEERSGMSLGEAGAALLLESSAAASERGAEIHAHLLGWGVRSDGHHPTAPHPEGRYLRVAVEDALADAGLTSADVDYVNAHGTGTRGNDGSEVTALGAVFGAGVRVASSKGITGHCMGAASAVEAIAAVLALREGLRFASAGIGTGTPLPGVTVQTATEPAPLRAVCSTSIAFGGVNAALVFGAPA